MKSWCLFLVITFALGCSGCVIRPHWLSKEASGTVRDADTGEPLADVTIYRAIDGSLTPVSKTDARGQFHVGAKRSVRIEVPLGDPSHASSLVFRKPGFIEATLSTRTITGDVYQSAPPSKAGVIVQMKKEPIQLPETTRGK